MVLGWYWWTGKLVKKSCYIIAALHFCAETTIGESQRKNRHLFMTEYWYVQPGMLRRSF